MEMAFVSTVSRRRRKTGTNIRLPKRGLTQPSCDCLIRIANGREHTSLRRFGLVDRGSPWLE